jgi:hypothetical protein
MVRGAADRLLRLQRVECYPGAGQSGGKVSNRLRPVQFVQGKVGLRELPLPQTRTKGKHRVIAARNVLCKTELRKQICAGKVSRGGGGFPVGACNRSLWVLTQCAVKGLPERHFCCLR